MSERIRLFLEVVYWDFVLFTSRWHYDPGVWYADLFFGYLIERRGDEWAWFDLDMKPKRGDAAHRTYARLGDAIRAVRASNP